MVALCVALLGCGDSKDASGGGSGNPLDNAFGPGGGKPTGDKSGASIKGAQPSTTASGGGAAVAASDVPATGGTLGKFSALAARVCACKDKACGDAAMVEFEQLSGKLGSLSLTAEDAKKLKATTDQISLCEAKLATTTPAEGRGDTPTAALGDTAKFADALGKHSALADSVCACKDKSCADGVNKQLIDLLSQTSSLAFSADDQQKIKMAGEKFNGCYLNLVVAGVAEAPAGQPAAKKGGGLGLAGGVQLTPPPAGKKPAATAKPLPRSTQRGRRGHEQCPVGKYMWGGKCDGPGYFKSVASRRSRIYFSVGKDCPPGIAHRKGTYCYACPAGKYWQQGGTCARTCAGAKDRGERKCTMLVGRRGHEKCAAGKYLWGGKCDAPRYFKGVASRRSRIYFGTGKDCPPHFRHRSGTYCHACPFGKYWTKGGRCVARCLGGTDYAKRECRGQSAGRRGHETCPAGQYMYAGKCTPAKYFASLASRRSRMFFGSRKDCPPGFRNRSGTHCYVCAFGKFWSGGRCVARCAGGTDATERKCQSGGGVRQPVAPTGVRGNQRRGHERCPVGQYMYAGKCTGADYFHRLASRKSKMFFGRSKSCPPGFANRQGTNCYVCRPGQYWSNGGCVGRCPGGTDLANRSCR